MRSLIYILLGLWGFVLEIQAIKSGDSGILSWQNSAERLEIRLAEGNLILTPMNDCAVRVRFQKSVFHSLPELIYLDTCFAVNYSVKDNLSSLDLIMPGMRVSVDKSTGYLSFFDGTGGLVLKEDGRSLSQSFMQGEKTYISKQAFFSPTDEYLFGLGQFQDGYLNVRGLTRRLTQVNTQISIPFVLSNKGYGLLWNNYGLTEFNPCSHAVRLDKSSMLGTQTTVDVTSTSGAKKETRTTKLFTAQMTVPVAGRYTILLDVGQKMARRHHLRIDGRDVIDVENRWLPPTASVIVELEAGEHRLEAYLEENDNPVVYYKAVDNRTVFRSPVSEGVDYTVFVGTPDRVIASYRSLTGQAPLMPRWALGYIHCRERFHSQNELLETARRFREESLPVDLIVQDWQYWGKYGWNAMQFDERHYPDPAGMVKELHRLDLKLMLSVWSKIDQKSQLGKEADKSHYFIPGTNWIDFFNDEAADFYWTNFSRRLLKPFQIDAWWQDATEPENDDLQGRWVMNGKYPGEFFRNVYPLYVNRTVYNGCRKDDPSRRTMILTRSGFSGMQRYGAATWSGDVGNDWDALRRQLIGGLGQMASGLPWWTYDAGGFFRPGKQQYTDPAYHECFLRWLQAGTFLPLLRVHGFQSQTEFWNYGPEVTRIARISLNLRYRLLPYIYSEAASISFHGNTLMRPLVMDFPHDTLALSQKYNFMFGPSILVAPVVESGKKSQSVYLPSVIGGWYDFWTGCQYVGGQCHETSVSLDYIPLFVKAGTILPLGAMVQHTQEQTTAPWEIRVYPGADGCYTIYEDEGDNYNYEKGLYATVRLEWDDKKGELTLHKREGNFPGLCTKRLVRVVKVGSSVGCGLDESQDEVKEFLYEGKRKKIKL